jgi:hypothetical protein
VKKMAALVCYVHSKLKIHVDRFSTTTLLKQVFAALLNNDLAMQVTYAATNDELRPATPGKDNVGKLMVKYDDDSAFTTWNLPPLEEDSPKELHRMYELQLRRR